MCFFYALRIWRLNCSDCPASMTIKRLDYEMSNLT
nr:MAG TPA: hypothetical protein [Caudoviricetes sp.]